MAIDPNMLAALQGPQPSQSPGLFGVQPQHLQQMAGNVVPMPGAFGLMFNTRGPAGRTDMPGRYISHGPGDFSDVRIYGPDPSARYYADPENKGIYENYYARRYGGGGADVKTWIQMHPSPSEMMRYFREQGLLPD